MQKFYETVIKHKKIVLAVFLAAFLVCLFAQNLVAVNYDMNDYLPEDTTVRNNSLHIL